MYRKFDLFLCMSFVNTGAGHVAVLPVFNVHAAV